MNFETTCKNISLTQFLELLDRENFTWMIKRLSGNDTGITGGHQSGIYVPRVFMEAVVPEIVRTDQYNPTMEISCYVPSHDCMKEGIQAKYYNNKYFPERNLSKKYNEFRMTCWSGTPLQDVENTGCICILAGIHKGKTPVLICWVSRSAEEEDTIEFWLGKDIEPGRMYNSKVLDNIKEIPLFKQLPFDWLNEFPSGRDIFSFIENKVPQATWTRTIDDLLLKRRSIEFEVFTELERHDVLPNIKSGFQTVDEFIKYANSVSNRRKSRAGTSLELHLESIFQYEQLRFETQVVTEQNKKPDFVFPSSLAYHDPVFPELKLHMLASKTCCKDRWRQVINEADRIKRKHLFTLQEGVSVNQLNEMYQNGIVLVVPRPILASFPAVFHNRIMDLTGFVNYIRSSQNVE
ncbi:MAG: type II restriction endonuclease [Fibrobacter sp.]|nr:type II restriction endonuclease [Fibrobacter sp.]